MQRGDVEQQEKGGDRGSLRGSHPDRGGNVGGALEHQGAGPFREEGGHPVDHVRGDTGGQESGSNGGGVDIVEGGFNV